MSVLGLDGGREKEYNRAMIKTRKKTREEINAIQELRRSNAARPHKNKSRYTRKVKHKNKEIA